MLDDETAMLLGALLSGDWAVADKSSSRARSSAAGLVAAYSQWHIERGLKSLQHVERE
jgi:DNA repair protein RecO (recombination protein O)